MRYTYSSDQADFAASARKVLAKHCTPGDQRALWDDESGRSPALWAAVSELGLPSILVPEAHDGFGGSLIDLLPFLEETGRAAAPDALLEATVLGPLALALAGSAAQQERWLPDVASGECRVTVRLHHESPVPDAHVSDLVVLERDGELWLFGRDDLDLQRVFSQDPSRRMFSSRPRAGTGERLPFGRRWLPLLRAHELIGSAAVLNGISARVLDDTVVYAKEREQFGRVIGSFQGVKHLLADAASRVDLATTAVRAAAVEIAGPDVPLHVADLARVVAADAERTANKVALQVHGGIGFTFEHDLQLWLKRGKVLELDHGGRHRPAPPGRHARRAEHGGMSRWQ
jgi:alkylation response protein AidB-like acyl-CoA dehydrogenase